MQCDFFLFCAEDAVLSHGTDHSPGTVTSQGKVGSSIVEPGHGNGICTSATCGSPSVISCSEPSPQKAGQGSDALLHHAQDGQSGDPKDCEASADAAQSSKQCSTRNVESAPGSKETKTAGGDKSFSFEVGAPPNASEKAPSPVWSPFPRYTASQSTEVCLSLSLPLCVCARARPINMVYCIHILDNPRKSSTWKFIEEYQ